jgi:ATP-dependent RNA helicase DDX19/DBP5
MSAPPSKAEPSGSLADRITSPLNAGSSAFTPAKSAIPSKSETSWADEVASPVGEGGSLAKAQVDGYVEPMGGSALHDGEHEVEVKLSDLQGDVNSPLHSVSSFEELGM